MDELISRADALAVAMHSKDPVEGIKNLPAADAVEVVRCKECKHWEGFAPGSDKGACIENECIMYDVDFCSYGVKRNEQ